MAQRYGFQSVDQPQNIRPTGPTRFNSPNMFRLPSPHSSYNPDISFPNFNVPPPTAHTIQDVAQSSHSRNNSQNYNTRWCPNVNLTVPFYNNRLTTQVTNAQHGQEKTNTDIFDVDADKEWVERFLSRLDKVPNTSNKHNSSLTPKLNIYQAKEMVGSCGKILQELKNMQVELAASIGTLSPEEWNARLLVIDFKKSNLDAKIAKVNDPLVIERLTTVLAKRRRKRNAMKCQRAARKQMKVGAYARRKKLDQAINAWLEGMQKSVEKVKSEESLKRQADLVLGDVTRKQVEARRQLALLSTMLKLRQLRVQVATTRGERVSVEQVNIFENVIKNLQTFWNDQLNGYNLEEKGLKVMLEEETQEQEKSRLSVHRTVLSEWQRALFGNKTRTDNYYNYTIAERDIDTFVQIRCDWDRFLGPVAAPMSSSIPIGWVLPEKPSSEEWRKLLRN